MAEGAYPTGYLAWGQMPQWTRIRRHDSCYRCQRPFTGTPTQKFCKECMGTTEHNAYLAASRRKAARNWYRREAAGASDYIARKRQRERERYATDEAFREKRLAAAKARREKSKEARNDSAN